MKRREYFLCTKNKNKNNDFIQQYLVMGDFKTLLLVEHCSGWTTVVTWTVLIMFLVTFLGHLKELIILLVNRGLTEPSDFIKNILICDPKMNEGLTGVEWHEGK